VSTVLSVVAEVIADQTRVARAEASLAEAKRRLDASSARLAEIWKARRAEVPLPPFSELAALEQEDLGGDDDDPIEDAPEDTLRDRVLTLLGSRPHEVFGPAGVAETLGARSRDSVRNTLLALADKGRIEKLGPGRYRARPCRP
jgi:hypothetical protein